MDCAEIRTRAIAGADGYYDWLKANKRGLISIGVLHIFSDKKDLIFKLDAPFHGSADGFITLDDVPLDEKECAIIAYDERTRELRLAAESDIFAFLLQTTPSRINVVSDLTFLVKRFRKWYVEHEQFSLPSHIPIKAQQTKFSIAPLPSEQQASVIQQIRLHPLSYVWGAPGTGKTQVVLAYGVLQYIQQGKTVLICAPTNLSLEQTLRGVIGLLDKAKIPRKCIRRIGTPTVSFRTAFPEVCEKVVPEQRALLMKELRICEHGIALVHLELRSERLKNVILELKKTEITFESLEVSQNHVVELSNAANHSDAYITALEDLIIIKNAQIKNILQQQKTIRYGIKSFFQPQVKREDDAATTTLHDEIYSLQRDISEAKKQQHKLHEEEVLCKKGVDDAVQEIKHHIAELQEQNNFSPKISSILQQLTIENIVATVEQFEQIYQDGQLYIENNEILSCKGLSIEKLEEKRQTLKQQLEDLEGSIQKDARDIRVWACTLDSFVVKQFPAIDHVFLDEAGYCSVIKSLPLLSLVCPITLLGDHKQLPPVCEMDNDSLSTLGLFDVCMWAQSAIYLEAWLTQPFETIYHHFCCNQEPEFSATTLLPLSATYRFGQALSTVLETYIYQNGFHSHQSNQLIKLTALHTPYAKGDKPRENPNEAATICAHVARYHPQNYAILTPYKNQVALLKKKLPQGAKDGRIVTIHGSQGKEWETVYVSICDTYNMWFTDSTNDQTDGLCLLNTAISRAKQELIIVCDQRFWQRQPEQFISHLLKSCNKIEKMDV